jgi:hypothetical protein
LAQGDFEVVSVVEGVHEIAMERMDVLESREAIEDGLELLGERLRGVLDFPGVELLMR